MGIDFSCTYLQLPELFYRYVRTMPVSSPEVVWHNGELAEMLGIEQDFFQSEEGLSLFSGNDVDRVFPTLAMAYAGHQFGNFVEQLGDGRAVLLGEVLDRRGVRQDIQLKGAGRTPFSRQGDGRAALGPVCREYVVSEAMAALGVSTTRALAVIRTGESVFRERELPGGILVRVAPCHVRVGTFEYAAAHGGKEALKALADYCIERFYPGGVLDEADYLGFFKAVVSRQAELVASWMSVGFIHGVMNTDNTAIVEQTIDYGPCAFMDGYDPRTVYSYIDSYGRYAYQNQPKIMQWNLGALANALLPILDEDVQVAVEKAQGVLDGYFECYEAAWLSRFCGKLGISLVKSGDEKIVQGLLDLMAAHQADFTLTFRQLAGRLSGEGIGVLYDNPIFEDENYHNWERAWHERLEEEGEAFDLISDRMMTVNPMIIPRNHLLEKALATAEDNGDFSELVLLNEALKDPFCFRREFPERFYMPPKFDERVQHTFCGT